MEISNHEHHPLIDPTSSGMSDLVVNNLKWEANEHLYLGNNALLRFDQGQSKAADVPLGLQNRLALTYGQIVALGGDFYGLPNEPISDSGDPQDCFRRAFATLAEPSSAVNEVKGILAVVQLEIDAVSLAIHQGRVPSTAYAALGDLTGLFNVATGGGMFLVPLGRYLKLAATNWDHFGTRAVDAYRAGHSVALAQAVAAKQEPDETIRRTKLALAYAMNAFADHFLTDLFSAGHLRTPRKDLYQVVAPSSLGSYLAKFMHDEDCCWGLWVQNAQNQHWKAYGDKRFFDKTNRDNVQIAQDAVQASVNEIWTAYRTGQIGQTWEALDFIPDLVVVKDWTRRENFSPLFVVQGALSVRRRTNPGNRYDYSWKADWWGSTTLSQFLATRSLTECRGDDVPFALDIDLIQLWDNNGRVGLNLYQPALNGYFLNQSLPDIEGGAPINTLAWLTGDVTGSQGMDFFQIWDHDGQLAMAVYTQNTQGQYSRAWLTWNIDAAARPAAVAWLTGDMDGDGKTDIFQLWDNQGKLALTIYSPMADGVGYRLRLTVLNLGESSAAIGWIARRRDGYGKTDIIQLSNKKNRLSMTIYAPQDSGGYTLAWKKPDMGVDISSSSGLYRWDLDDVDGDGRADIIQSWTSPSNQFALAVYEPLPQGQIGYQAKWNTANLDTLSSTIGWVRADAMGTGRTDMIRLWDNKGKLGLTVYSPVYLGYYHIAWSNPNVGPSSKVVSPQLGWIGITAGDRGMITILQLWPDTDYHLSMTFYSPTPVTGYERRQSTFLGTDQTAVSTWLTGDMNGDGHCDLIRLWNNNKALGMMVYSATEGDRYDLVWKNDAISQQVTAVAWLTGDMDGDGKTNLFQFWIDQSFLALTIYSPSPEGGYVARSNPSLNQTGGAVAWLAGDMKGIGKTDLFQIRSNSGNVGMTIYSPQPDGSYAVAWNKADLGHSASALAWLTGDMNGDGKTDLIQPWDNKGKLGLTIYSPQPDGSYAVAWNKADLGHSASALAWLTGDMNGDGKTNLIQLWNNGGKLAITVYALLPKGDYGIVWSSKDMKQGPGALAWLTGDVNGDGKTNIIQLWDNKGKLGMIMYSPLPEGKGYSVTWDTSDLDTTSGAAKWLIGDMNADGKGEIMRLTNDKGGWSCLPYYPFPQARFTLGKTQRNVGPTAQVLAWLTVGVPLE